MLWTNIIPCLVLNRGQGNLASPHGPSIYRVWYRMGKYKKKEENSVLENVTSEYCCLTVWMNLATFWLVGFRREKTSFTVLGLSFACSFFVGRLKQYNVQTRCKFLHWRSLSSPSFEFPPLFVSFSSFSREMEKHSCLINPIAVDPSWHVYPSQYFAN